MKALDIFGWLTGLGDFVFGYDFFISYAHDDGNNYPRRLADRLEQSGFHVFLDERVYVAGDDLKSATKRRIRMSKKLVFLARPASLQSQWCTREIEEDLAAGRTPILIDVNRSFQEAGEDNRLKHLLEDHVFIIEATDDLDGEPSQRVLGEVMRSLDAMRVESRRVQVFGFAALVLLLVSITAFWQYRVAEGNANKYLALCTDVVTRVRDGNELIKGLGGESAFGQLIAAAATDLAKLPDFDTPEKECSPQRDIGLR